MAQSVTTCQGSVPHPLTSETPWTSLIIQTPVQRRLPEAVRTATSEKTIFPNRNSSNPISAFLPFPLLIGSTLTAFPSGDLFLFGGRVRERVDFDFEPLDTPTNQLFSVNVANCSDESNSRSRSISFAVIETLGEPPSTRQYHGAARIGSSLLVVWGGQSPTNAFGNPSLCDTNLHVFSIGKSLLSCYTNFSHYSHLC